MDAQFFSWDTLKTITGVSTATGLITQFIKEFIPIPTQITAYLVALILLVSVEVYNQNYRNIPLCFINGFIASSIASNTVALVNRITP